MARWQVTVGRAVHDSEQGLPFNPAKFVVCRSISTSTLVARILSPPALQGPLAYLQHGAGPGLARTGGADLINQRKGVLTRLPLGQLSASEPNSTWAFFFNINNAAVSANAFSLRCNSRTLQFPLQLLILLLERPVFRRQFIGFRGACLIH